jgi:hypothetical protein
MRAIAAKVNNILSWIMFIGVNIAFFLIALSVFGAAQSQVHAAGGFLIWLVSLLNLIAALIARTSWLNVGVTFLTAALIMPVQGILVHTEFPFPAINALHAVNGLAILYLSYMLANGRAKATFKAPETASAATPAAD